MLEKRLYLYPRWLWENQVRLQLDMAWLLSGGLDKLLASSKWIIILNRAETGLDSKQTAKLNFKLKVINSNAQ